MRINAAKKTETIVMVALFSALIAVMTAFVKVPTPIGYIHIGDAFIFAGAMLLGPYAAIPAMIGSGLADLVKRKCGSPSFCSEGLLGIKL